MNLLHVFVCTWNESKILQDFIDWYRSRVPGCLITVYDNESTDNTVEIALQNNCKVISFSTNDQMDELTLMNIRNNCWKKTLSEWCLVVDADELVDINAEFLKNLGTENILKCKGYEMFGEEEDSIDDLIYGCESVGYSKPVLFRGWIFEEISFAPGNHSCSPIPFEHNLLWSTINPNLYHTKWRSWSNGIERAHLLAKKRSDHSRQNNWNIHYEFDDSIHLDYYSNGIKNRIKVR